MVPAHHFDQALGHHETDACALFQAGIPTEPIEWLEELGLLFFIQPLTCVPNADANSSRGT